MDHTPAPLLLVRSDEMRAHCAPDTAEEAMKAAGIAVILTKKGERDGS